MTRPLHFLTGLVVIVVDIGFARVYLLSLLRYTGNRSTMNELNDFQCMQCGNCCRVSGYVRLKEGEAEKIAAYLGLSLPEFTRQYTCLTDDRTGLSLTERPDRSCIFLDERGACRINDVKPRQCKTFPVAWRFSGWDRMCRGAIAIFH